MHVHKRRGREELKRRREGALERLGTAQFNSSRALRMGDASAHVAWERTRDREITRLKELLA